MFPFDSSYCCERPRSHRSFPGRVRPALPVFAQPSPGEALNKFRFVIPALRVFLGLQPLRTTASPLRGLRVFLGLQPLTPEGCENLFETTTASPLRVSGIRSFQ